MPTMWFNKVNPLEDAVHLMLDCRVLASVPQWFVLLTCVGTYVLVLIPCVIII